MKSWRAFLETVHVLALSLWFGGLVMSGFVAARTFAIMKDLDPRLASHAAYTGDHWRLAGGKIANGVFAVMDVVQFVCAFLAGLSFAGLVVTRGVSPRRVWTWIRGIGVSGAMASVMGLLLIVEPQLNTALRVYWKAAAAGNNDEAAKFQKLAGEIHPTASTLMGVTAVAVLVALVGAAWTLGRGAGSVVEATDSARPGRAPEYPEPALLQKRRGGAGGLT